MDAAENRRSTRIPVAEAEVAVAGDNGTRRHRRDTTGSTAADQSEVLVMTLSPRRDETTAQVARCLEAAVAVV